MSKLLREEGFDFSFNPERCNNCGGKCCLGSSGYVWITTSEVKKIARLLSLSFDEVTEKYLDKYNYRYSIKETKLAKDSYACIFFNFESENCSIYEARPLQCKTFPFWDDYLIIKDETFYTCPAIVYDPL